MDTKVIKLLQELVRFGEKATEILKAYSEVDPLLVPDNSLINHRTQKVRDVYPDEERSWLESPFNAMLASTEAHCIYRTVKEMGAGSYADLGVMHGASTAIMGHALHFLGAQGKIYSVDLFGALHNGKPIGSAAAVQNLRDYFQRFPRVRLEICQGTTNEWAARVKDRLKLVFIDADHSYQACREDFENWTPKVISGGYVALHDTHFRSVDRFVQEIDPSRFELVAHVYRLKLYRKL